VKTLFFIAIGGAIGSVSRYLCVRVFSRLVGDSFPWGTMIVNVVGGFLIGVLVSAFALRFITGDYFKAFLFVGVLGGFTTFSAFTLELADFLQQGQIGLAFLYAAGSVIVSLGACAGGLLLVRGILA
jgi:CrcB protein